MPQIPRLPPTARIPVRVQPSARKTELVALREGVAVIRVAARPHDGKANAELCRFLADRTGIRASRVTVVRGQHARDKLVQLDGVDQKTAEARIGLETTS